MINETLNRFFDYTKEYGIVPNEGVSIETIRKFNKHFQKKFNVQIPKEYELFLSIVNGIEFDGLIFYGIDKAYVELSENQIINGLIENNKIWNDTDTSVKKIVLGENDMDLYVYDIEEKEYVIEDRYSKSAVSTYTSFDSMAEDLINQVINR